MTPGTAIGRLCLLASPLLVSSCLDPDEPEDDARLIELVGPAQLAGTPLDTIPDTLMVRVTDARHHPIAGATVTWTTADGGVIVPQGTGADADGIARALWILGWRVGQRQATATVAGAPAPVTFTAVGDVFRAGSLSAGNGDHVCAIADAGELFCWGWNDDGELGDGTFTDSERPVAVKLELPVTQVVTGYDLSCALTSGGSVYCWGANDMGQLGNGSTTPSPLPTMVSLPAGRYLALSAMDAGVCALAESGAGYCWGDNREGRFGIGTTDSPVLTPARIAGDIPWRHLALGDERSCGIGQDGLVYCWGSRPYLQGIGVDTNTVAPLPVTESPPLDLLTVSGWHICGITSDGAVYCWGGNYNIGVDDPREVIPEPLAIPAPAPVMSIHSTYKPTYALGADGKGYWWGPPPRATGGGPFTPVPFTGEIPIRAIGIHDDGACGVEAATGGVYCWSGFLWDGPTRIGAVAVP